MAFKKYKKDPDATLDYEFDWSDWLTPIGDTIVSVQWVLSAGLTLVNGSNTTTSATAFVSGGVDGDQETLTCRVTTNSTPPRIDDRTVILDIQAR